MVKERENSFSFLPLVSLDQACPIGGGGGGGGGGEKFVIKPL